MAHDTVDLLSNEVEVAAASGHLHDPDGDVDGELAPLSKDCSAHLTVRVQLWVPICHQNVLHHRVNVQKADDREEKDAAEPASLAEDVWNGQIGVTVAQLR